MCVKHEARAERCLLSLKHYLPPALRLWCHMLDSHAGALKLKFLDIWVSMLILFLAERAEADPSQHWTAGDVPDKSPIHHRAEEKSFKI